MNTDLKDDALANLSRDELMSAMFANLVFQNTNMALMFLGQVPHPQTGEKSVDAEAARMFIDQLEMLEVKTKGNLTSEEQKLLQQSLMHLRLTFVEAVQRPDSNAERGRGGAEQAAEQGTAKEGAGTKPAEASGARSGEGAPKPDTAAATDEDSRKRFSKKY